MISLKTAHPKLVYTCDSAICMVVQGWGANTRNIFTLGMLIGVLIAGVVGVLHMSTESGGWEGSSGILHPASCRSKEGRLLRATTVRCVWFQGQRYNSLLVAATLSRPDYQWKYSVPISNHDFPCLQLVLIASHSVTTPPLTLPQDRHTATRSSPLILTL